MISITLLTKNNEKTLNHVLTAIQSFPEVILLDTGSNDRTLDIAKEFSNVKIFISDFTGFGTLRKLASSYASHDWILSLDSDEIISEPLKTEILSLQLNEKKVYSFPFHNYFNGRLIKGCGWYPDRHVRLYNRKTTQFSKAQVHEGIEMKNVSENPLKNPILHYSYGSVGDFLKKMQIYSSLFAEQYQGKKKSSLGKAIWRGFFAFFKSYIIKRGFLDGEEGFIISAYNGQTAFYKYLKLLEANRKSKCS